MGALLTASIEAREGPGGLMFTVPDAETMKSRKSPKTMLGKSMLQDKELVSSRVCANEASRPFTDHTALICKEKTAINEEDSSGTNSGFSSNKRRQGDKLQPHLMPT